MNTLITETTENGEIATDIYTKMADDRMLFITNHIDDQLASDIAATLLLKDYESGNKITLFINSEGATDIRNVFTIYDTMQLIECPIETICVGSAMNETALILAAGSKGMRFATPNAVICLAQLAQEKYYRATLEDAKGVVERIHKDNKAFIGAIAKKTGNKVADVMAKAKDKWFMSAKQAKTFGLIDGILGAK